MGDGMSRCCTSEVQAREEPRSSIPLQSSRWRTAVSNNNITGATLLLEEDEELLTAIISKSGETGLHLAARERNYDMLQFLLDKGIDPNIQSIRTGDSALHICARANDPDGINILLKCGASADVKNKSGKNPRMMATQRSIVRLLAKAAKKIAPRHSKKIPVKKSALLGTSPEPILEFQTIREEGQSLSLQPPPAFLRRNTRSASQLSLYIKQQSETDIMPVFEASAFGIRVGIEMEEIAIHFEQLNDGKRSKIWFKFVKPPTKQTIQNKLDFYWLFYGIVVVTLQMKDKTIKRPPMDATKKMADRVCQYFSETQGGSGQWVLSKMRFLEGFSYDMYRVGETIRKESNIQNLV